MSFCFSRNFFGFTDDLSHQQHNVIAIATCDLSNKHVMRTAKLQLSDDQLRFIIEENFANQIVGTAFCVKTILFNHCLANYQRFW